jgi:hypothetical protein
MLEEQQQIVVSSASGSALNGIQFFSLPFSLSPSPGLGLCCAGYDQRLGVWEVSLPLSIEETAETKIEGGVLRRSSPGEKDCPLRWLGGTLVNIGDVNSVALLEGSSPGEGGGRAAVAVVGEGCQLFELQFR